jgi:hypothetical protein
MVRIRCARGLAAVTMVICLRASALADAPDGGAPPDGMTADAAPEAARPPGQAGPIIEMPPEPPTPPTAPTDATPIAPRGIDPLVNREGSYSTDLGAGRRIPIGAYGEAFYLRTKDENTLTLRRIVLFFGHRFADWVSVFTELEVEHLTDFEIEQAYLEFTPWKKPRIGFRIGLVLIPLGIINQYHEPPTWNGVVRPTVDQIIIPTTWRELGIGVYGRIVDGLHFQLYAVGGADGSQFGQSPEDAPDPGSGNLNGFAAGLSRGEHVNTENVAVTGRLNFNRVTGLDVAAGFYYGSANSKEAGLSGIALGIVEADARFSRWGLMLRAEYVRTWTIGADKITTYLRQPNVLGFNAPAVGAQGQGFYGEAGYNLLYPVQSTRQEMWIFGRYEHVDPRIVLPEVPNPIDTTALQFFTVGFTYKPRPELAFKFDYRRTLAGDDATGGRDRYSLGVGFMY